MGVFTDISLEVQGQAEAGTSVPLDIRVTNKGGFAQEIQLAVKVNDIFLSLPSQSSQFVLTGETVIS
ncbi:hypothetical protein LCGC14_2971480, partial [marine sediment metagenome]